MSPSLGAARGMLAAMKPDEDPRLASALLRYQVISAYLALEPKRGQRGKVREQLAAKTWTGPDGERFEVSAETIRVWVRRYRNGGLHLGRPLLETEPGQGQPARAVTQTWYRP